MDLLVLSKEYNDNKKNRGIIIFWGTLAMLVICGIIYPLTIHSDVCEANEYLINPLDVLDRNPSIENTKRAVEYIAINMGFNETELMNTLKCESGFEYDAKNPNSSASGVAQFLDSTWSDQCVKKYNFKNKKSASEQLKCMAKMWERGLQKQWKCWKPYLLS